MSIGDGLVALAGTPAGANLATGLALTSAVAHAAFGALQKGRHDPWLSRGAIDLWLAVLSLPVALFLVPLPTGPVALALAGAVAIHFLYKFAIARAYERAAYTVVYPVMRGSGPLFTVAAASLFLQEHFTLVQWVGVAFLTAGILSLAARNLADLTADRAALKAGLGWAVAGGLMVAVYTTWDAWGIRQAADPFTFLAWFFFITALDFPLIAYVRWRRMALRPATAPLMLRGFVGAIIAYISFGGVMLATRIDTVGQAAVLRETSTVFAALIGWLALGEKVGTARALAMAVVALGAVIVERGG